MFYAPSPRKETDGGFFRIRAHCVRKSIRKVFYDTFYSRWVSIKGRIRNALSWLFPSLSRECPHIFLDDRCPHCQHVSHFTLETLPATLEADMAEWQCQHCGGKRVWNKKEVRHQLWDAYLAWLEQQKTYSIEILNIKWTYTAAFLATYIQHLAPVTFAYMVVQRIGHLALAQYDFILNLDEKNEPKSLILVGDNEFGPVSNSYMLALMKRIIPIHAKAYYINKYAHGIVQSKYLGTTDLEMLAIHLEKHDLSYPFTNEEHARAQKELAAMGVQDSSKIICLHVRDNSYLKAHIPIGTWSYHDYRNADVDNYRLAMEHLADQGYTVLRMGAIVAKPIAWESERIIDYATRYRTEFMDVWLAANCALMVSTGSGIDSTAAVHKRPCILTDFLPCFVDYCAWSSNPYSIWAHKSLKEESTGRYLTLKEIWEKRHIYFDSQEYIKYDLQWENLSPEEIDAAIQEMIGRMNGSWVDSEEDIALHEKCLALRKKYSKRVIADRFYPRISMVNMKKDRELQGSL